VLICDHAYRAMRRQMLERQQTLAPVLEKHGLRLRVEFLGDGDRSVWDSVGWQENRAPRGVLNRLDTLLDRLEEEVLQRTT